MSYGLNFLDPFQRTADYVDKILAGQNRASSRSSSRPNSIWPSIDHNQGARADRAVAAACPRRRGDRMM